MRKYILFFMLLAFSMGAAAQPQITRKPKPKKEKAKPNNAQRNQKPAANQSQKQKSKVVYKNKTFTANGVSFNMVYVEGGTFQMGSNDGYDSEKPVHSVTLSDYYIGQTEVTQELWQAVMGSNPSASRLKGAKNPVNDVSWNDCQEFISKLNRLTGGRFRLPTEAEWEYAARGGNKSRGYIFSGSNYLGSVAWYFDNSGGEAHPVGSKSPNELGLYDMSGNVWEWCSDRYGYYPSSSQTNPTGASSGSYRVSRGGGWFSDAAYCRVAIRDSDTPTNSKYILGLRLAH